MTEKIRIILADDHPIVRQGLRQMIEADEKLAVVAEAGDGREAIAAIEKHEPQIAVLDVDMPEMDGFAVAREISRRGLSVEIIFLTMHSKPRVFYHALDLGAKGYVLKDSAVSDITASIKAVAAGKKYISPTLSNLLLDRHQREKKSGKDHAGLDALTPTELKILKLIADGKSSTEIADAQYVSRRTVETHRANISRKLELEGNLSLVRFALEHRDEL